MTCTQMYRSSRTLFPSIAPSSSCSFSLSLSRSHYYDGSFLQITVRRRGTVRIQTRGIPTLCAPVCAYPPLFTYTRHTCPQLACTRLTYDETPATTVTRGNSAPRRTLGSPRRPYVEEATLFFSRSSFSRPPATYLASFSIGERLVERAARR